MEGPFLLPLFHCSVCPFPLGSEKAAALELKCKKEEKKCKEEDILLGYL
jgi:hypothetical protein